MINLFNINNNENQQKENQQNENMLFGNMPNDNMQFGNVQTVANVQNDAAFCPPTPIFNPAGAFSIVGSVAAEENSLASIIQEEAEKLNLLSGTNLTFTNFTEVTQSITRTLKAVLLKNTVLEAKLTETLNYIDDENFTLSPTFLTNLTSILNRIATEENALGNLIAVIGTAVRLLAPNLSLAQLQAVDELVVGLMRVIAEKNLVLLSKLRRVVRFLVNNAGNFPPPTTEQIAAAVSAIINLINSINVEENGLAVLIEAEAAKLNRAVVLTTTAAGVPSLIAFNNTITSVIDVIVQKNLILEAKLEEILALISLGFNQQQRAIFAAALSNLQQSIANEEFAIATLINTEALKINDVATLTPGNIGNLVAANESVTTLLESITLKNMVLGQKNLEIINFIQAL